MANEEQRRAFASYMGTADASAGQQAPQQAAAFAGSGNPYLFQQFSGVQGLPAAPTPPPAAPSSVASYSSYQGGFQAGYQGGYPQGAFPQGGYQQNGLPHRPPPLGQSEVQPTQQSARQQAGPPGYPYIPGGYGNQAPSSAEYDASWQYIDPMVQQTRRLNGEPALRSAMVPSSRNFSGGIVESRAKQTNEQYHYHQYGSPPRNAEAHPPPVEDHTVPVLLCHTCSVCSRMRSAGYHRNNPVVPGKPLVLSPCRRCKKKTKSHHHSGKSYMRVRSCTAEEPCDWPRDPVRIDTDLYERRGRRRSREDVHVYRHSPSRPRVVKRSSSQAKIGLHVLQDLSPRPQVSSLSHRRASRYDEVWPPPDVVRMTAPRAEEATPAHRCNPNLTSRDEVWPPPDVVRTHSYKRAASPLRRQSSRIIELSLSPPPARTRSTRVVYRSESSEHRTRSISPVRIRVRDDRREGEAEARMMSHPRPYRPVMSDRRNSARASDETSSNDYMPRGHQESPSRRIPKPAGGERETSRRRMSMRESHQSTTVEIGGPKVHFHSERREERVPASSNGERLRDTRPSSEEYEHYRNYSRHRFVDDRPPAPPVEEMERLRVGRSPLTSQRSYEDEIHIDRARRLSPSPLRRHGEIRVRHVSPLPRDRERSTRPPLPAPRSPERPAYSGYRHISRTSDLARTRSLTPPPSPRPRSDDITDSDSAHSGEVTEVRSWKGIDENGQPTTFVEERRTVRMLEQESEREGLVERRQALGSAGVRSWRDV